MGAWVVLGILVVLAIWTVSIYNGLVRRRIDCDNGWAQIDVQLRRRYDLIPNLVETVKGYAAHEQETFDAVVSARNRAMGVASDAKHAAEKGSAEAALTQTIGRLFALAEAYPELKANESFLQLQEQLATTENRIGFARQHFNDVVARYEQTRQQFPASLVAGAFSFDARSYFEIEDVAAREAPAVSFS